MTETKPMKSLKDRSDEELYALVEKNLAPPPFNGKEGSSYVDRDISPERIDEDGGDRAYVSVFVCVRADDFPADGES